MLLRVEVDNELQMQNFSVDVDYDDTVENLLVTLTLTIREDPKKIKLFYKGQNLNEQRYLKDYGIADGDTIEVKLVSNGCCCNLF